MFAGGTLVASTAWVCGFPNDTLLPEDKRKCPQKKGFVVISSGRLHGVDTSHFFIGVGESDARILFLKRLYYFHAWRRHLVPHTLVKTTTAQQQSKERRNYIRSHCVYVYTIMWTNAHRIQIKKIYEQPQQIYKYIW